MVKFILPIVFLAVTLEIALRQIPNDYSYKNSFLNENSHELEILVLGNSHSFRGITPSDLDLKAFNAAYVSQSLDYDIKILEKFIDELDNLKFVIINISQNTLYQQLDGGVENWRIKNYNIYYDLNVDKNPINHSEILSGELRPKLYRLNNYYVANDYKIDSDSLGYGPRSAKIKQNFEDTGKESASRHNIDVENSYLKENLRILDEIVQLCDSNNIKLILFTPPAVKEYTSNLDMSQMERTRELIRNYERNSSKIIYKDFLFDKDFNYEHYYNADHLNVLGAKLLTKKLNKLIIQQRADAVDY